MAGAASPFAVAGIASRTFSPTWGRVLTTSRWIGSTTMAITNPATVVGRPGSSKCSIGAHAAANAIPMPSLPSMTCCLSGDWRVTEPRTDPWHQCSESATQTWGTSCEGRHGGSSSETLAVQSPRGNAGPTISHSSKHRYARAVGPLGGQALYATKQPEIVAGSQVLVDRRFDAACQAASDAQLPKVEVAGSSPISRCAVHLTSMTRPGVRDGHPTIGIELMSS
jgi:hypothetical protein